ncbi:transporter substrate-binding domain-containing protein [Chitinibacter sp. SCUT-21]|uniref:substrate-binding periplasmic protein n=1 Tax=Chitinibacter sp. SCUT-21 TaxID=2970891 RepID=UPI0035A58166
MRYLVLLIGLIVSLHTSATGPTWRTAAEEDSILKWKTPKEGFCPALFALLNKEGQTIEYVPEFVPQKRIEYWIKSGELDLMCGLAKTEAREQSYSFINIPIYRQDYVLVARRDDPVSPKSWDEIKAMGKDAIILLNRDGPFVSYLQKIGVTHVDSEAIDIEANFRKLMAHRGRYTFHAHRVALKTMKDMQLQNELRIIYPPLDSVPFYLLVGKHISLERQKALENALSQLERKGETQKLAKEWFTVTP